MSLTGLLLDQAVDHPVHFILEITFATVLTYVLLRKRRGKPTKPIYKWPSLEEQERRLAAFRSEPFRAEYATTSNVTAGGTTDLPEVEARSGVHLTVHKGHFDEPTECLDLGTYDYHSFSTNPDILDTARKTVMAYGVGSCGPRGFYGTVKPHLDAEENIAKFLHTEDAVVYSFAYATVSTLISCYASKGDYLVYDGMCNSSIVEGCRLCRANLSIFRHNDMTSLEEELKAIVAKENPNKPNRRYVVTEGVFKNMGDMCPLPAILALCDKYKFRLILEDSYGFGAVGPTGRGTPEHYGIPTSKVDVYVGSLSTSLGAVGGFCAGAIAVTDFQRLGASAYVFSASLPPYITASAAKAIELLDSQKDFTTRLHERTRAMRGALRSANFNAAKIRLVECVNDASPVIVLAVQDDYVSVTGREKVDQQLAMVVKAIERRKIVILRHIYAEDEPTKNVPSLRLVAKGQATEAELNEALNVIVSAVKEQFN